LRETCERVLPQVKGVVFVPVSALTGKGIDKLLGAVLAADVLWNKRLPTHALNQWLQAAVEADPSADILVINLGIFVPRPFEAIAEAEWKRFSEVNVMSGVRLARHYLPGMKAAGWGRIVFISSESGINTPGEMVHYGMTKSAQLAVSRGLAQSCAGTGITVNAVLPGPTRSEGVADFFGKLAAESGVGLDEMERRFFAEGRPTSIIKRMIDPAEVAALVAYVCSARAAATTGAALRVDGGIVSTIC